MASDCSSGSGSGSGSRSDSDSVSVSASVSDGDSDSVSEAPWETCSVSSTGYQCQCPRARVRLQPRVKPVIRGWTGAQPLRLCLARTQKLRVSGSRNPQKMPECALAWGMHA